MSDTTHDTDDERPTTGTERVRQRVAATETDTETETERDESLSCPECSGRLVSDTEHGETVCADCGLVVADDEIDRGPEWRAFDSAERDRKSRVGRRPPR